MDLFLGFEKIDFCRSWIYLEDGLLVSFGDDRITPHLCQPFLGVNCCEGLPRCPILSGRKRTNPWLFGHERASILGRFGGVLSVVDKILEFLIGHLFINGWLSNWMVFRYQILTNWKWLFKITISIHPLYVHLLGLGVQDIIVNHRLVGSHGSRSLRPPQFLRSYSYLELQGTQAVFYGWLSIG